MSRPANQPLIYCYKIRNKDGSIDRQGLVRAKSKGHVVQHLLPVEVYPAKPEDVAELMSQGHNVDDTTKGE